MARYTITTTPVKIAEGVTGSFPGDDKEEFKTRSFTLVKPAGAAGGTVLLERGDNSSTAPSMTGATRYDFATLQLAYECEPGVALWAATSSGSVDVDVLQGGER